MDRSERHLPLEGLRMSRHCELEERCGFFRKFGLRQSQTWQGLVNFYCHGGAAQLCERLQLFKQHGEFPADDVMPNGTEVPAAFQELR